MRAVTKTFAADLLTPVIAYDTLRAQAPGGSSFLLESVMPEERWGRFSIIGYRPASVTEYGSDTDLLGKVLNGLSREAPVTEIASRFCDSAVGYLSYDLVHAFHGVKPWSDQPVLARFMRDFTVVLFDNLKQTVTLAAGTEDQVARCERELRLASRLEPFPVPDPNGVPDGLEISMSDDEYAERVDRVKEYILSGDAFQVVLARTFRAPQGNVDPFEVYRALRILSPSPYLYFLEFGALECKRPVSIIGASPETMVRYQDRKIALRPIAGTRPRGETPEADERNARELLADTKECAEHVMLIDLARNDVGRVAKPGSVELLTRMQIERYSHVMHIVSEVQGLARDDVQPADVIRAAFPAGTLTGAPKVRATQIIRELETRSRGIYGGAVGYMSGDGCVDLAIAIRTVVAQDGYFEVSAGAGLVEASDPYSEAQETRSKARAALAAICAAQGRRR